MNDVRSWKEEGDFESGCFTAEANNAALTVSSSQPLYKRKQELFLAIADDHAANGGEAIGGGQEAKRTTEFIEWFRERYLQEYQESLGLNPAARRDFTAWLARDYGRWFEEEYADVRAQAKLDQALNTAEGVIRSLRIEGPEVFLPARQLERKLYEEVKSTLMAMGGAWDKKTQGFVFRDGDDPAERINTWFATGKKTSHKKEQQAFFTPAAVAERAAEIADLADHHTIMEPSAGRGALVLAILGRAPKCRLYAYEQHPPYFKDLEAIKAKRPQEFILELVDFLHVKPTQTFDRILMNPPYGKKQDAKHIQHAARFLASHGRLTAILLQGKGRALLEEAGLRVTDVEPLPDKAFQESGTTVKTEIVTGVRR